MTFSQQGATAIDLCARDAVMHSHYKETTTIYGSPVDRPFDTLKFCPVPTDEGGHKAVGERFATKIIADKSDLVVVHQHLTSANHIKRLVHPVPVILHKHGWAKSDNFLQWLRHNRNYKKFAATIWVSEAMRADFVKKYPAQQQKAHVVWNGLDLSRWKNANEREKIVLVVGRAVSAKGILEAAKAVCLALRSQKQWRAHFILSTLDSDIAYLDGIRDELASLGASATIELDQPHDHVKNAFETAAIAIVPTTGTEPFGRTALEAMAGGAALISSTMGGLREVVDGHSIALESVNEQTLHQALVDLIDNQEKRANLSKQARLAAEAKFSIEKTASRLDQIYDDVMAVRG